MEDTEYKPIPLKNSWPFKMYKSARLSYGFIQLQIMTYNKGQKEKGNGIPFGSNNSMGIWRTQ